MGLNDEWKADEISFAFAGGSTAGPRGRASEVGILYVPVVLLIGSSTVLAMVVGRGADWVMRP